MNVAQLIELLQKCDRAAEVWALPDDGGPAEPRPGLVTILTDEEGRAGRVESMSLSVEGEEAP